MSLRHWLTNGNLLINEVDKMKWEDYQKRKIKLKDYTETSIECPKCGKHIYRNHSVTLCTYPPQYYYKCFYCKWEDIGY